MKQKIIIGTLTLFVALIFGSCKKEKVAAASKDYTAAITNKTWWGTLTNAGRSAQPYSVHFNADKTLLWNQQSGDYTGTWAIEKNKLTLTFPSPAVIVTADISDDNKWTNITTNTANKVNSGELLANPDIALENTVWTGDITLLFTLQITFLPNRTLQARIAGTTYSPVGYSRSASGGAIRFTVPGFAPREFFGVLVSGSLLKGYDSVFDWHATKQ